MFKGVIFDLDGVIVSTDKFHYTAWKNLADREGIYFDEEINNRLRGISRRESLEIVIEKSTKKYSEKEISEMMEYKNNIYKKLLIDLTPNDILDDIPELLHTLKEKGVKISIGSSSKNADTILTQIGLKSEFDEIADGNDITNTKPDPEVFLVAAQKLNLNPNNCLVVEDAVAGAEAGKRANMKVFCVGDACENKAGDYNNLQVIKVLDLF